MFVVRDKRSGKFMKSFSGSRNDGKGKIAYRLGRELGRQPTIEEVHSAMWSLESPNGAKVYKTKAGVTGSFKGYRYRREVAPNGGWRHTLIPLEEACPWLEILEVEMSLAVKK